MFRKLIPRELGFFDLFDRHIEKTVDGAKTFQAMLLDFPEISGKVHRIEEIEHECDEVVHLTKELLHKTFITPLDRDDIQRLISGIDNVMDYIHATVQRLILFEIKEVHPILKDTVKVLNLSLAEVQKIILSLKNIKSNSDEIQRSIVEIHRLENEGDGLLRASLANLFKEHTDALYVLKWKEIFETLEAAIDECEDIADVVQEIMIENQ